MSRAAARSHPATLADLLARPEGDRCEHVAGELVPKEASSALHGVAQGALFEQLAPFRRRPGGPPERPGGWWFAVEALVELATDEVRRPDVAGWRRERLATLPAEAPVRVVPDWSCEVLSPSNASTDTIEKMSLYHRARVGHHCLLDPRDRTLAVHRWHADGSLRVLGARAGERVHAEPFEAIALSMDALFGDEE